MMDSVKDFVSAIGDGDNLSAETHFNSALAAKVGDALETKRQEVAKTFVTHHVPEVEDSE
tara:strand:- start:92 stop:271 length:180 start_codon:yes stop_codon:yes gene_type:complete